MSMKSNDLGFSLTQCPTVEREHKNSASRSVRKRSGISIQECMDVVFLEIGRPITTHLAIVDAETSHVRLEAEGRC